MVPDLGVKQDAIPGFLRDTWFRAEKVGVYRGQCAELCGKDHAYMPIVVNVLSQEDFAVWAAEQRAKIAGVVIEPAQSETAGVVVVEQPLNNVVDVAAPVVVPVKVSEARF
jgi:cytochrome c oxidase subunit 2